MKEELPKPRKKDTWQVTEAKNELRQIVNNSHHLLTVPDQYRASFVSEWIRLYLEFAAHLKQFPTKHRHLDDRVLHKYGSPSTPYLFHLGNIKKVCFWGIFIKKACLLKNYNLKVFFKLLFV